MSGKIIIMDSFFLPSFILFALLATSIAENAPVTVTVKAVTPIHETDENLVCATLDWWPKEKCNYGWCPWYNASIINLDLTNPILYNAIKAFKTLRVRLGGSLQDQVIYRVGKYQNKCTDFQFVNQSGLFGFTSGCLNMTRWDELNTFFNKTGTILTFGLNALLGRTKANATHFTGSWDSTNARDFMSYTVSKGYKIESWEFGNELSGHGVDASVDAKQYGKDLIKLKKIINKFYKDNKPKLLAPGGFFDMQWFTDMLQSSGPNVVDVVTHHLYNLGPGSDVNGLPGRILNPFLLSQAEKVHKSVEYVVRHFGPWSTPWVGESGGAYNSGGKDISDAFIDSFWYLDQLGMVSVFGHSVFCRQALIGGNYALLNPTTFIPNPDYYSALLWSQLMGTKVLQTTHNGSPYFRSYTHCTKNVEQSKTQQVTSLFINLSNSTSFEVSLEGDYNIYAPDEASDKGPKGVREEYHLTPEGGNIKSKVMLLNGHPLKLTADNQIPEMKPSIVDDSEPLIIAAYSIAFVTFKNFNAPACPKS